MAVWKGQPKTNLHLRVFIIEFSRSEWNVGNPETDRLPWAGSISEWPVTRSEFAPRS